MTSNISTAQRTRYALLISVVATIVLYKVPQLHVVAYPLMLISTLVHEMGHGVAALLAGGTFHHFYMFDDGSGVAYWSGHIGDLGRAFIAAGGLVGPAIGAAVCFACARRETTARYCLGGIGIVLVLAELAVVRNLYGVLFVGVLAGVCLLIALRAGPDLVQLGLVFLAVQLALSVYARSDYLFTKVAQTKQGLSASDSQHIAEAMGFGSYWFWGAICALFSAAVLILGGLYFLRGDRLRRSTASRA